MQQRNILDRPLNLESKIKLVLANILPYFAPKLLYYHVFLLFFQTQRPGITCYVICLEEPLFHFSFTFHHFCGGSIKFTCSTETLMLNQGIGGKFCVKFF